jgi:hypothetical protein
VTLHCDVLQCFAETIVEIRELNHYNNNRQHKMADQQEVLAAVVSVVASLSVFVDG